MKRISFTISSSSFIVLIDVNDDNCVCRWIFCNISREIGNQRFLSYKNNVLLMALRMNQTKTNRLSIEFNAL